NTDNGGTILFTYDFERQGLTNEAVGDVSSCCFTGSDDFHHLAKKTKTLEHVNMCTHKSTAQTPKLMRYHCMSDCTEITPTSADAGCDNVPMLKPRARNLQHCKMPAKCALRWSVLACENLGCSSLPVKK
ncbi:unnamed protein product, partial [Ixodes persulcatus]